MRPVSQTGLRRQPTCSRLTAASGARWASEHRPHSTTAPDERDAPESPVGVRLRPLACGFGPVGFANIVLSGQLTAWRCRARTRRSPGHMRASPRPASLAFCPGTSRGQRGPLRTYFLRSAVLRSVLQIPPFFDPQQVAGRCLNPAPAMSSIRDAYEPVGWRAAHQRALVSGPMSGAVLSEGGSLALWLLANKSTWSSTRRSRRSCTRMPPRRMSARARSSIGRSVHTTCARWSLESARVAILTKTLRWRWCARSCTPLALSATLLDVARRRGRQRARLRRSRALPLKHPRS